MKELIEQIGGRERLEQIVEFGEHVPEAALMARALLAVLDAKPVGTVSIAMDWSTHRNIATVNMRPDLVLSEMRDGDNLYATPPAASVPCDYFSSLVSKARQSAEKAMIKYPQPNYVLLKVAEEAGEVVQAGVHYAEGRETWDNLEGEVVQTMAMLYRLVTEGDQVNGVIPPAAPAPGGE